MTVSRPPHVPVRYCRGSVALHYLQPLTSRSRPDDPHRRSVGGSASVGSGPARDSESTDEESSSPGDGARSAGGDSTGTDASTDSKATTGGDGEAGSWLRGADPVGSRPDRQLLVVGDGVAGLALAGLLGRAGYDPVLVGGDRPDVESRLTCLWPCALGVLASLGVETAVRDHGYPVEDVSVALAGDRADRATGFNAGPPSAAPVVVETATLRRLVADRLPATPRRGDRRVASLSRSDDALEVRFDDGVREWFDVVVDAGGGTDRPREVVTDTGTTGLTQYELPVRTGGTARRLRDVWHPDGLAQVVPRPDGSARLLRVTTAESEPPEALWPAESAPTVDALEDCRPVDGAGPEATAVEQADPGVASVDTAHWGVGRVPTCGPAGFPVAPATSVRETLALEDARALAELLVQGPHPVPALVDAYAGRRSRRLTARLRQSGRGYPVPDELPPELAAVGRLRSARFAGLTASPGDGGPGDRSA